MGTKAQWGDSVISYATPSDRYPHGVFGSDVEPTQIVDVGDVPLLTNGPITISAPFVFEDRLPRLVDTNQDGTPEILTIVANPAAGAGVWLWRLDGSVAAKSDWHGIANRWLNPFLGGFDFDDDGNLEIGIVRTPHIGSVFQVLDVQAGKLQVVLEDRIVDRGLSNHAYGDPHINTSIFCPHENAPTNGWIRKSHDAPLTNIEIGALNKISNPKLLRSQEHAPDVVKEPKQTIDFQAIARGC